MVTTAFKGRPRMIDPNKETIRRVRVSKQRQISIPKDFYDSLNIEDEALLEFTGNAIVIHPADFEDVDFSQNILRDLMNRGYSGEELIEEFGKFKSKIPQALRTLKRETMEQPTITGSLGDYLDSLEDNEEDE